MKLELDFNGIFWWPGVRFPRLLADIQGDLKRSRLFLVFATREVKLEIYDEEILRNNELSILQDG